MSASQMAYLFQTKQITPEQYSAWQRQQAQQEEAAHAANVARENDAVNYNRTELINRMNRESQNNAQNNAARQSMQQADQVNANLAIIQNQNSVFNQALQSGKITQAQYNQAMGVQTQNAKTVVQQGVSYGVVAPDVATKFYNDVDTEYNNLITKTSQNNVTPAQYWERTPNGPKAIDTPTITSQPIEHSKPNNSIENWLGNASQASEMVRGGFPGAKLFDTKGQVTGTVKPYTPEEKEAFKIGSEINLAIGGVGLGLVAAGPIAVAVGVGSSLGISQGAKAYQVNTNLDTIQKQNTVFSDALSSGKITKSQYDEAMKVQNQQSSMWLTPSEALQATAVGAALGPIGGKAASVLNLTGKGVAPLLGRVGINTLVGGTTNVGLEYFNTGKASPEAFIIGAGYGAGFTLLGEGLGAINSRYNVTGRVTETAQGKIAQANLSRLENINTKYEAAYNTNQMFKPTLSERMLMRTANLYPVKPNPQVTEIPTIPTASKINYETYRGYKEVTEMTPITNRKGEVVDMFKIPRDQETLFIREKPLQPNSYRNLVEMNLQQKTSAASELIDAGTMIYGKSQPPEMFYEKVPVRSTAKELPTYESWLQGADLREVPSSRKPLGFKKTVTENRLDQLRTTRSNSLRDITNNIDLFQEIPQGDVANDVAIVKSQRQTVKEATGVSGIKSNQQTILKEKTGLDANQFMVEKMLADAKAGRSVITERRTPTMTSIRINPAMVANPFIKRRFKEVEDSEISMVYPKGSPLAQPTVPITVPDLGAKLAQRNDNKMGFVGITPSIIQPVTNLFTPTQPITNKVTPITTTSITPILGVPTRTITTPDITQITTPIPITIPIPKIDNTPITTPTYPGRNQTPYMPNIFGSKYDGSGFDTPTGGRSKGKKKQTRFYPVLSPLTVGKALITKKITDNPNSLGINRKVTKAQVGMTNPRTTKNKIKKIIGI